MGGPAAFAAHDEIVAIPIVLDATLERDGGGLDSPLLPRLGTGNEIAIVSPGELRKWTIVLLALSIVLEDQIRLAAPNQPEAHADTCIIGAVCRTGGSNASVTRMQRSPFPA